MMCNRCETADRNYLDGILGETFKHRRHLLQRVLRKMIADMLIITMKWQDLKNIVQYVQRL